MTVACGACGRPVTPMRCRRRHREVEYVLFHGSWRMREVLAIETSRYAWSCASCLPEGRFPDGALASRELFARIARSYGTTPRALKKAIRRAGEQHRKNRRRLLGAHDRTHIETWWRPFPAVDRNDVWPPWASATLPAALLSGFYAAMQAAG